MIGFLIAPNKNDKDVFESLLKPFEPTSKLSTVVNWANNPRDGNSWGFNHNLTLERIELVHQINIAV